MKVRDYARRLLLPAAVAGLLVASLMVAVVLATDITPPSEPARPATAAAASSTVGAGPAAVSHPPAARQPLAPRPPTELSPLQAVRLAWQRARDAAGYHFATDLAQVTFPAHSLAAAGSAADHTELYLEGALDVQAETLDLKLWEGGGSVASPSTGAEMRVAGGRAYSRRLDGTGSWEEVPDFSGSFAPGSDALAFLAGFKNLKELAPRSINSEVDPAGIPNVTDGRFAESW